MPGQSGLDLCGKIRKRITNRATPVVFVTAHSDFESRAQSVLSGGNDFIAKPFLSSELAVKALSWLLRGEAGTLSTASHKKIDQPQQTNVAPPLLERACLNGKYQTLAVPVGKS
jgi:DNA-binding response OmpR family regulator